MLPCRDRKLRNGIIDSIKLNTANQSSVAMTEDNILRLIEQAVIDNRLAPGTKLKEVQLAELFGVKRGTIRKVLTRLAHSRLVEQLPNRGASVARPSIKEARDLFSARRAIERAIVEILAQRISAAEVSQLRNLLDEEQLAYQQGDVHLAIKLSVDFHRQIASMADNSVLTDYLDDIIRRTPLVVLTHIGSNTENVCRNHEHEAIIDAIANGDGQKAALIMDQHLLHIENQIAHKPAKPAVDLASILLSTNFHGSASE